MKAHGLFVSSQHVATGRRSRDGERVRVRAHRRRIGPAGFAGRSARRSPSGRRRSDRRRRVGGGGGGCASRYWRGSRYYWRRGGCRPLAPGGARGGGGRGCEPGRSPGRCHSGGGTLWTDPPRTTSSWSAGEKTEGAAGVPQRVRPLQKQARPRSPEVPPRL